MDVFVKGAHMKVAENANGPPLLLDVKEVAYLLGVGERTVWAKAAADLMPKPVRIGRLCRWRRAEIEKWIEEGCLAPTKAAQE